MKHFLFTFQVPLLMGSLALASGQEMAGNYRAVSEGSAFTLTLEQGTDGTYTGALAGEGGQFSLEGRVEGETLTGQMSDGFNIFSFRIVPDGTGLSVTLFSPGESGDLSSAETLVFQKVNESSTSSRGAQGDSRIIINGQELSKGQIRELIDAYATEPLPGNYWYDARSGLYGAVGFPAYGFMRPDHKFGSVDRKASKGDTGVFINGRELPLSEFTVWSYIVGSWIQPGAYWLDHQGNAGNEGNPTPVINLYTAAQQNSYTGRGSGGDNFWSTRFSAGNYNEDNSQGYVSVPGYGPIGYGF